MTEILREDDSKDTVVVTERDRGDKGSSVGVIVAVIILLIILLLIFAGNPFGGGGSGGDTNIDVQTPTPSQRQ